MAGATATYTIKGKDQTKAAFRSVRRGVAKVSKSVFSLKSAVVTLAGAAGFGLLIKSSLAAGDSLAKTSDKLGIATQQLAGLRHAAELSGVSANTLDTSLQRMIRRVSEAAQGTGEAKNALFELGLSAKQLASQAPDEQFRSIAEAMGNVGTQGDRVRLAMRLFDTEGVALVNTLAMGKEGLDAATESVKKYGLALTRVEAAKIEAANDALTEAKTAIKGVAMQITVALAPWIKEVAQRFADLAKETGGFKNVIQNVFTGIVKAIAYASDSITAFQQSWNYLKLAVMVSVNSVRESILSLIGVYVKAREFFDSSYEPPIMFTVLQEQAAAAGEAIETLKTEIEAIKNEPWDHEVVNAWFDNINTKAQESAIKVAENRLLMRGTADEHELAKQQETERQLEFEDIKNQHLERLQNADRNALALNLALWESGWRGKAKIVGGILGQLSGLMQSNNKKQFEIGKKAAIANTVINTAQMAVSSYNALSGIPYVGPFLGALAAAAAIAYGKVQIDNIKSQQFNGGGSISATTPNIPSGGGGGGPGGGGGGGLPPGQQQQAPQTQQNITLVGRSFSGEDVRDLIVGINEQLSDDVNLNVVLDG